MPSEDLGILYSTDLYSNAWCKGIYYQATTDLILHLSWGDAGISHNSLHSLASSSIHSLIYVKGFSKVVVRMICNNINAKNFAPFSELFVALLALQDSEHTTRVCQSLEPFLEVFNDHLLDHNFEFRRGILHRNATVCHWMADNPDKWLHKWLLHDVPDIRTHTFYLVLDLTGRDKYVTHVLSLITRVPSKY